MVIETDGSKRVSGRVYHGTVLGNIRYAQFANAEVAYRPMPSLKLALRLDYNYWNKKLEYVATPTTDEDKKIYMMSGLVHKTTFFTMRVDYIITPELSIQFYGNPYISTGKYADFKRATNTMDKNYDNRFYPVQPAELAYNTGDNTYAVNETLTGNRYSFDNPDFSFREFRFNLVTRWEYKPNSILYLVWAQDRSGRASEYIPSFSQNTKALFNYYPGNVFMVKLNYWFSM
jgi:hypothetical protein